jgi:hypothetical protein
MKKLIFLLLMALLAGFVFAGVAHPPGAYSSEAVIALADTASMRASLPSQRF